MELLSTCCDVMQKLYLTEVSALVPQFLQQVGMDDCCWDEREQISQY
jgi:hypothetical protein